MVQAQFTITHEELMKISSMNSELRFERHADRSLVAMAPTGEILSNREIKAGAHLLG